VERSVKPLFALQLYIHLGTAVLSIPEYLEAISCVITWELYYIQKCHSGCGDFSKSTTIKLILGGSDVNFDHLTVSVDHVNSKLGGVNNQQVYIHMAP